MADGGNGYPAPPVDEYRDREYRERDRDRDRGGDRRDRDRDRDSRRRDDDRHKSSRHRSRSRSRDRRRSKSRSRSRTPPRRQRRRPTQWDVLPEGGVVPNLAAVPPSQVPGVLPPAPAIPGLAGLGGAGLGLGLGAAGLGAPGIDPLSMAAAGMSAIGGLGALSGAAGTAHSQQATRHARRVYVGGLPPTANEGSVSTFFSHALAAVGGNTAGPGQSVVNVYMNRDKNFAFIEFRTAALVACVG